MKKSINLKILIPAMAAVLILLIVLKVLGLVDVHSGARLGFAGNSTSHTFTGKYTYLSGTDSKTMSPSKNATSIHCEFTSKSGSLHVTVTEKESGNVICDRDITEDTQFDLPATGKVYIKLNAASHKGSYRFTY